LDEQGTDRNNGPYDDHSLDRADDAVSHGNERRRANERCERRIVATADRRFDVGPGTVVANPNSRINDGFCAARCDDERTAFDAGDDDFDDSRAAKIVGRRPLCSDYRYNRERAVDDSGASGYADVER
jgi:hypothetical protein